jgi:integrase
MATHGDPVFESYEAVAATVANYTADTDHAAISVVTFIENKFIPDHVRFKSAAGRTHYRAILNHILKPETVQTLFGEYPLKTKARLSAVPGWPYLDDLRLCDLNADHVRQLTASAIDHGYSAQTVKHIKNVLGTIISHAKKEHIFSGDNPVIEVKLPRLVHARPRDLTIDQAMAILQMLKYPDREIALISMTTGMGISEICALRWKDINLTPSTVYIDKERVPPRGIIFRRNWTGIDEGDLSRERLKSVVVPESLIRVLERLKRQRGDIDPNGFVVATPQGDPIEPQCARAQRLKPIGRRLQIPWLSWQVLKLAHGALLSELNARLADDLVHNARCQ